MHRTGQTWALIIFVLLLECTSSCLCDERPAGESPLISYSGFIDGTFAHDLNSLPTRKRPYTTQPYYSDEASLNLGYADAELKAADYHGRLAVQYGSSVIANYSAEPDLFFRYIQEAYLGSEVAKGLTLDVGIFFSHIGMESWISRDNINLGRSLIAENSPYYQSGARVAYTLTPAVKTELYLVRGWQNISANEQPALGTRTVFTATPDLMIQHSTFLGDVSGGRLFNHLGISSRISRNLKIIGGYDLGLQERRDNTTAAWHGWALSAQYQASGPLALGFRVERYSDPSQVIIQSLSSSSFTAVGLSMNLDYAITSRLVWRNEYRAFIGSQDVFPEGDSFRDTDSVLTTSLQYSIGKLD